MCEGVWNKTIRESESYVIITNYNKNSIYLRNCLESVKENATSLAAAGHDVQVIVVDDGSTDDSEFTIQEYVKLHSTRIISYRYLQTGGMHEFNGTLNYAVARILSSFPNAKNIITLDADTMISENFLSELIEEASNSEESAGLFATKQFWLIGNKKSRRLRSTGHEMRSDGAALDQNYCKVEKAMKKAEPFCPCFSGSLIRAELLRKIGLILPEYAHYYTCPELGFRARLNGWTTKLVVGARMWHASRSANRNQRTEIPRIWNMLRFFPTPRRRQAIQDYIRRCREGEMRDKLVNWYVYKARETCPPIYPVVDSEKEEVYQKFVTR